jgi:hypothetical protein
MGVRARPSRLLEHTSMHALAYDTTAPANDPATLARPRTPQEAITIRGWIPPTDREVQVLGFHQAWVSTPQDRAGAYVSPRMSRFEPGRSAPSRACGIASSAHSRSGTGWGFVTDFAQPWLLVFCYMAAWLPGCKSDFRFRSALVPRDGLTMRSLASSSGSGPRFLRHGLELCM